MAGPRPPSRRSGECCQANATPLTKNSAKPTHKAWRSVNRKAVIARARYTILLEPQYISTSLSDRRQQKEFRVFVSSWRTLSSRFNRHVALVTTTSPSGGTRSRTLAPVVCIALRSIASSSRLPKSTPRRNGRRQLLGLEDRARLGHHLFDDLSGGTELRHRGATTSEE